jgi:hypothetical protein
MTKLEVQGDGAGVKDDESEECLRITSTNYPFNRRPNSVMLNLFQHLTAVVRENKTLKQVQDDEA